MVNFNFFPSRLQYCSTDPYNFRLQIHPRRPRARPWRCQHLIGCSEQNLLQLTSPRKRIIIAFYLLFCWFFSSTLIQHYIISKRKHWYIMTLLYSTYIVYYSAIFPTLIQQALYNVSVHTKMSLYKISK